MDTDLPNCQMLHSNLAVAWSVFAPSMTIQLIGNVDANDYIGFGFSEPGSSKMVGSDVAIAYVDGLIAQVDDYNITAKSPCTGILGVNKGVCRDEDAHVGGTNDNQIQTFSRDNGITKITYRKTLGNNHDSGDLSISDSGKNSIVWAIGKLARPGGRRSKKEPSFHHTYPRSHVQLDLNGNVPEIYKCRPFVQDAPAAMLRKQVRNSAGSSSEKIKKVKKTWGPHRHFDYSLRTFDARLGPPGGK